MSRVKSLLPGRQHNCCEILYSRGPFTLVIKLTISRRCDINNAWKFSLLFVHLEGNEIFLCWWMEAEKPFGRVFIGFWPMQKQDENLFPCQLTSWSSPVDHKQSPAIIIFSSTLSGQENKQVGKMRKETANFSLLEHHAAAPGMSPDGCVCTNSRAFNYQTRNYVGWCFVTYLLPFIVHFPLIWQLTSPWILSQLIRKWKI